MQSERKTSPLPSFTLSTTRAGGLNRRSRACRVSHLHTMRVLPVDVREFAHNIRAKSGYAVIETGRQVAVAAVTLT